MSCAAATATSPRVPASRRSEEVLSSAQPGAHRCAVSRPWSSFFSSSPGVPARDRPRPLPRRPDSRCGPGSARRSRPSEHSGRPDRASRSTRAGSSPTARRSAIYPGPLLPNLQQRPISQAGIDALVDAARSAGLLDGPTDLTGGLAARRRRPPTCSSSSTVSSGRSSATRPARSSASRRRASAHPGTPEAFGQFWAQVHDIGSWLGTELGAETPYVADRLAVLLVEPVDDASLPPSFARWPLEVPMTQFGVEWPGSPPARCGVIEGADLAPALAAFGAANELTRWTDDTDAQFGAVVRPLFPGEPDPCAEGSARVDYDCKPRRSGGMADATVSNTVECKLVWVRIPPSAPELAGGEVAGTGAFPDGPSSRRW